MRIVLKQRTFLIVVVTQASLISLWTLLLLKYTNLRLGNDAGQGDIVRPLRVSYELPHYPGHQLDKRMYVNNENVSYIIDNKDFCSRDLHNSELYLLVLILNSPGNPQQRVDIRNAYGAQKYIDHKDIRYVFLLAATYDLVLQKSIVEESKEHGDIVQFSFSDGYRSLVNKTVGGLQWIEQYCDNVKYVMKTDDDVMVFPERAIRYLKQIPKDLEDALYNGKIVSGPAIRDQHDKWYVPFNDYPYRSYPSYAEGLGILMSKRVVKIFFKASRKIKMFPIEDAYLGLLAFITKTVPTCNTGIGSGYIDIHHYRHCRFRNLVALNLRTGGKYFQSSWILYKKGKDEDCLFRPESVAYGFLCSGKTRDITADLYEIHMRANQTPQGELE